MLGAHILFLGGPACRLLWPLPSPSPFSNSWASRDLQAPHGRAPPLPPSCRPAGWRTSPMPTLQRRPLTAPTSPLRTCAERASTARASKARASLPVRSSLPVRISLPVCCLVPAGRALPQRPSTPRPSLPSLRADVGLWRREREGSEGSEGEGGKREVTPRCARSGAVLFEADLTGASFKVRYTHSLSHPRSDAGVHAERAPHGPALSRVSLRRPLFSPSPVARHTAGRRPDGRRVGLRRRLRHGGLCGREERALAPRGRVPAKDQALRPASAGVRLTLSCLLCTERSAVLRTGH